MELYCSSIVKKKNTNILFTFTVYFINSPLSLSLSHWSHSHVLSFFIFFVFVFCFLFFFFSFLLFQFTYSIPPPFSSLSSLPFYFSLYFPLNQGFDVVEGFRGGGDGGLRVSVSLLSPLLSLSPQQSNPNSFLSSHLSLAHSGGYYLAWVM